MNGRLSDPSPGMSTFTVNVYSQTVTHTRSTAPLGGCRTVMAWSPLAVESAWPWTKKDLSFRSQTR